MCKQDRVIIESESEQARNLPYLSLEHIESNSGRILRNAVATLNEGQSSSFAFDSRHILYGKLRPYLNKVALPDFAGRCTTELIPLLPENADREFLAWMLRRKETVNAAMQQKTGSRMPRADMDELLNLESPIPSFETQQSIVVELNQQMQGVEQLRAPLEEQLAAINKLSAALLRQAFNGEL